MHPDLDAILDDARMQIARGDAPDADALEARIRSVDSRDRKPALDQLNRLLAVARARRAVAQPRTAPAPTPRTAPPAYRAKPTIAANMTVRARSAGAAIALEWPPAKGVTHWEARISDRADARSSYVERETRTLDVPSIELELTELPVRIGIAGRNANGRIVQRALVSGLTRSNWDQKWLQRPSAS